MEAVNTLLQLVDVHPLVGCWRQSLQNVHEKLCQNLSSYFTLYLNQLAREEDACFDGKGLRTTTENYKSKKANVEFRA